MPVNCGKITREKGTWPLTWITFIVNLEEGTPTEELPGSGWPVGMPGRDMGCGRSQPNVGLSISRQEGLG